MPPQPGLEVRVTHRFPAPPERVFDAWLDARLIAGWFGPGLGDMVRIIVDARVGGTFSFVQRRDGDDVDHTGEYLEVDRPHRLAFTWSVPQFSPDADVITIDIAPIPGQPNAGPACELTLIHELQPEWRDYAARVAASWSKMLAAIHLALD